MTRLDETASCPDRNLRWSEKYAGRRSGAAHHTKRLARGRTLPLSLIYGYTPRVTLKSSTWKAFFSRPQWATIDNDESARCFSQEQQLPMRILVVADIHANWPALQALDEPHDV